MKYPNAFRELAAIMPLALALAACGNEAEPVATEEGTGIKGDVLPGSISDAMLPIDTVTSTAPLMGGTADGEGGDEGDGEGGDSAQGGSAPDVETPALEVEPEVE